MKERNKPRLQDPIERAKNFNEVNLGFDEETAVKEATRCLQCKKPFCVEGCPVGVNIPGFIERIYQRDFDGAAKILKGTNMLPAICGRVCPQEVQCESKCILGRKGESVAIGALERFVGDYSIRNAKQPSTKSVAKGKVAVVGSGPAGLTCAADCRARGLDVTIFESLHEPGGVLTYGIPEFRLPIDIVKSEIESLEKMGVKIELNVVIGKTIFIEELLATYDAVFLGSGAGLPIFLGMEGENLPGVYSANEYLTRVNLMGAYKEGAATPLVRGKVVAVVGAGNVAMDSARTALRLGAEKVMIVYRRSREEMPARREEIEHALEEGIEFLLLTNPVKILGQKHVEGMEVIKMELGDEDEKGRRRPIPIEGSNYNIECDQVIMAIGTNPNPLIVDSCPELKTGKNGVLVVDENLETSIKNVFAGGDAISGSATVIQAMGAGRRAAKSIIERLAQ
ncbi:MAG: NADPH-dependent glutamate synthase [Christensenellales bacterium]|jgi:glutamate synthase (NADPH/NADH) small chain|nr:NADPH-dependent glutamate synthase [Clostridiales bacterium]